MKKIILFAIIAFSANLYSQTQAYLDCNNVKALILNRNDMFWDINGNTNSAYEVPKGSGKQTGFVSSLWIGGYDASNLLHVGAMSYRQNGVDFWPGPLDTISCSTTSVISNSYNRVWKVSTTDINNFITAYNNGSITANTYTPANDIVTWPGNGNVASGYPKFLAPFVDLNANGIYEWQQGDHPRIKGDQMIWYVVNDQLGYHSESQALPLGIEMQVSAYAYNCQSALSMCPELDYTTFYNYKVINRSNNQYNNTYMSIWNDADLGYYLNDYIGCDTVNQFGYIYNADQQDYNYQGFHHLQSYKVHKGPLADPMDGKDNDHDGFIDEPFEEARFSNFMFYNNNVGPFPNQTINPDTAIHYYNYLRGIWKDGSPLRADSMGVLAPTNTVASTRYAYPGNIQTNTGWTESFRNNPPGDRRLMIGNGPFTFKPNAVREFEFSIHTTMDSTANGNMNLAKLTSQQLSVDAFWNLVNKPSCQNVINSVKEIKAENLQISLYPNPANESVQILSNTDLRNAELKVFNSLGQLVAKEKINSLSHQLKVNELANGIYFIEIKTKESSAISKLIKN